MNRQNAFAVLLPLVMVALCFAQTRSSAGNTYRSKTDRFQIILPGQWPVSEGGDVTVKAVNNRGASINVAVSPYNGPEPTPRDLNQMLELGAAQTKREYPGAVILEKGLRLPSGKRGPYQKYRDICGSIECSAYFASSATIYSEFRQLTERPASRWTRAAGVCFVT